MHPPLIERCPRFEKHKALYLSHLAWSAVSSAPPFLGHWVDWFGYVGVRVADWQFEQPQRWALDFAVSLCLAGVV